MKSWPAEYILKVLHDKNVPAQHAAEAVNASAGSIGRALELASDDRYWEMREEIMNVFFRTTSRSEILKISNAWKERKQDADQFLGILETFVGQLAEARFSNLAVPNTFPLQWQRFSKEASPERFLILSDCIANARKQIQYSVNFQAVFEKMIFTFMGEGNIWLQ